MWPKAGIPVENGLTDLRPVSVFIEYDGPRIFTCLDSEGGLLLAYHCDEADDFNIFCVAAFTPELERKLTAGMITIFEALSQPRIWAVHLAADWHISEVRRISIDDVPMDLLPDPDVMLWPSLQPLLNLRAIINEKQGIVSSIIRDTVDAAERSVKRLLRGIETNLSPAKLRLLWDLPMQRLAFRSFEISLRAPNDDELAALKLDPTEVRAIYSQVGELLNRALELATDDRLGADSANDVPDAQRDLLLDALSELAPSTRGAIEEIQVSGRILGTEKKPVRVSKRTRRNITAIRKDAVTVIAADPIILQTGFVREFDRDKLAFRLKQSDQDLEVNFEIEDAESDMVDRVIDALQDEYMVAVSGRRESGARIIAVAVERSGQNPRIS
ncbi:MAG TPA: hypothetical protein VHY91_23275 [Pirellulales bacterium]|jgi:hypothetical protein|nr:hypothetical protein [Pirellulales bacterium]